MFHYMPWHLYPYTKIILSILIGKTCTWRWCQDQTPYRPRGTSWVYVSIRQVGPQQGRVCQIAWRIRQILQQHWSIWFFACNGRQGQNGCCHMLGNVWRQGTFGKIGNKMFSQVVDTSSAERCWSTYSFIHNVRRYCLNENPKKAWFLCTTT